MISAYQVNETDFFSLIGRGFVDKLKKSKPKSLVVIKLGLLFVALLILVGYALTLYFLDNWSKMGIVISISVVCMDLFNYIVYSSKMV